MERTALSKRELRRAEVLTRVKSGELRVTEAADQMKTSYRNAKRLWKRYEEACAYVSLTSVKECSDRFAEFDPVEL